MNVLFKFNDIEDFYCGVFDSNTIKYYDFIFQNYNLKNIKFDENQNTMVLFFTNKKQDFIFCDNKITFSFNGGDFCLIVSDINNVGLFLVHFSEDNYIVNHFDDDELISINLFPNVLGLIKYIIKIDYE